MTDQHLERGQEEQVNSDWASDPFLTSVFIRDLHINGVLQPGLLVTVEFAAHPGVSKEFASSMAVVVEETIAGMLSSPSDKT